MLIIGGSAGTIVRYILSGVVYQSWGTRFPYGTLIVNLFGCFLVGYFVVITEERYLMSPNVRLLLLVGFCGAFTTFSTFILETANLVRDGESLLALANILVSVIIGFICFKLGMMLGEII
jgi:CrcB protein